MAFNLDPRRFWFGIAGITGVLCLVFYFFFWKQTGRPYDPPQNSFDGSSERLAQTIVVPTLDTPLLEGKSALWCSSFQLAWNRLKTDIAQGPIQLRNAEPVAGRLNRAEQSEADLDSQDF